MIFSSDLVRKVPGLTSRRLDYWCRGGIFGPDMVEPGHYVRRRFDETDVPVAVALSQVSNAINAPGGPLKLYREVAQLVRDGHRSIDLTLGPGVNLVIDIDKAGF